MMTEEERRAYEKWLRDNNVPDYMRRLYADDPIKIRDAMRKKREAEYQKQAEKIREAKESEAPKQQENTLFREEKKPKTTPVKRTAIPFEEEDWEDENAPLYGKPKKKEVKKQKKYYAEDAEIPTKKVNLTPQAKKVLKISILSVVAAAIFSIILILIVTGATKSKYELGYITKGQLDDAGAGSAYIIRYASTATAPGNGVFVPSIEEGKKVEAGGTIGYITQSENKNIVSQLEQIKQQIVTLQNAEQTAITSGELFEAEQKIAEQKDKLEKVARSGNFDGFDQIVDELNTLIAQRDEILLATKTTNLSITELQQKKNEYEQIIDQKMRAVVAETAGVVSYYITGNENVERSLYSEIKLTGQVGDYGKLTVFSNKEAENRSNKEVKEGEIVCRIVSEQDYYLVVATTSQGAEQLSGIVTMSNNAIDYQAAGNVVSTSPGTVIVSTMRSLKASMPYEKINVEFSISSRSGYTVPITALTDWDENKTTARLAVVRANRVKFVYVGVLAYDNKEAIISSTPYKNSEIIDADGNVVDSVEATFNSSDCYLINAKSVKEGQLID